METQNRADAVDSARHVLATDLDGTLIPLDGNQRNQADLETLANHFQQHDTTLVYVTGRHFASVMAAMTQFGLPQPDWLICDVGTSIFRRQTHGAFHVVEQYRQHQQSIIAAVSIDAVREQLDTIDGLRLQEPAKQGEFKLSYYADAESLDGLVAEIQDTLDRLAAPFSIIHSVDPFNGDGLIDLLPSTVSKAHALAWWTVHAGLQHNSIVFAGDSGNDLAALTAGYHAIIVGNADRSVADRACKAHLASGWQDRLYLANGHATSGVLEGCRWFGLFESPATSS